MKTIQELRELHKHGTCAKQGWIRRSIGFDKEETYLRRILNSVVLGDEETGVRSSQSLMIYGVPGVGKTTLVESALAACEQNKDFLLGSIVVRLCGSLCTDLRSSIEEIGYQLRIKDLFVEEDEDEELEDEGMRCLEDLEKSRNFEDRLEKIMKLLRMSMEQLKQSIVFVLDHLDKFAEHTNQRLLYNLYDLAANSKSTVPICVIGVTDRVDVLELFEKRVKSRFSHRTINLLPKYTFEAYKDIVKRFLSFPKELVVNSKRTEWNKEIDTLIEDNRVKKFLNVLFDTDPTILKLDSFLCSVLLLAEDRLQFSNFKEAFELSFSISEHVAVALDLPITELIALLSIYTQIKSNKQQAWQPGNLYNIVRSILKNHSLEKEDYLRAIWRLEKLQLIVPVSKTQRNAGGLNNVADIYFKCELSVNEFQQIWARYPQIPTSFTELL